MQKPQTLNLGLNDSENVQQGPARSPGNASATDAYIDAARSDVWRLKLRVEQQEQEQEIQTRRTKALSIALVVLVAALAAASWFVYRGLRGQQDSAANIIGLQSYTSSLAERVEGFSGQLGASMPALSNRIDEMSSTLKSGLQTARTQAEAAASRMGRQIRQEVNQSVHAIESRLAAVESNERESGGRMNALEEQMSGLKRDLASVRQENSAYSEKIQELQNQQQTRIAAMTNLNEKLAAHQTALDSLSSQVESKRVDFEIEKSKTQEIAPGVALTLRRPDVKKQQLDATLQLTAESRMMSLRSQAVGTPVMFYMSDGSRPAQLVFRSIEKDRASGYILLPESAAQ